jgi:hypothetical protein
LTRGSESLRSLSVVAIRRTNAAQIRSGASIQSMLAQRRKRAWNLADVLARAADRWRRRRHVRGSGHNRGIGDQRQRHPSLVGRRQNRLHNVQVRIVDANPGSRGRPRGLLAIHLSGAL